MGYAIYIPLNAKTYNRTYDGCLWKLAKRYNVRTSKQLRFVASTETFNGNQALSTRHSTHVWFKVTHSLDSTLFGSVQRTQTRFHIYINSICYIDKHTCSTYISPMQLLIIHHFPTRYQCSMYQFSILSSYWHSSVICRMVIHMVVQKSIKHSPVLIF